MRHFDLGRSADQVIVDPIGENRCFHRDAPWLWQGLNPPVQFVSLGSDRAFLVNLPADIFYAVADGLLVNVQSDLIHMSVEEPPWLFSESTISLSSVFVHHALLLDLAFKQLAYWPAIWVCE
jgi:hypothetical protein